MGRRFTSLVSLALSITRRRCTGHLARRSASRSASKPAATAASKPAPTTTSKPAPTTASKPVATTTASKRKYRHAAKLRHKLPGKLVARVTSRQFKHSAARSGPRKLVLQQSKGHRVKRQSVFDTLIAADPKADDDNPPPASYPDDGIPSLQPVAPTMTEMEARLYDYSLIDASAGLYAALDELERIRAAFADVNDSIDETVTEEIARQSIAKLRTLKAKAERAWNAYARVQFRDRGDNVNKMVSDLLKSPATLHIISSVHERHQLYTDGHNETIAQIGQFIDFLHSLFPQLSNV